MMRRYKLLALFVALHVVLWGRAVGWAQSSSPASGAEVKAPRGTGATDTVNATVPDVFILAIPLSGEMYAVSVAYSGKVPKVTTETNMQQVLAAGGWQGERFTYDTKAMQQVGKDFDMKAPQITTVEGFVKGAIAGADGSLNLGPFLMGFRDWNTMRLTVATPKQYIYRGPKSYADDKVAFTCEGKEGLVSCMAKIKDQRMEELTLPQYDTSSGVGTNANAAEKTSPSASLKIWAIVGASMAVGIAAFLLARRAITR